MNNKRKNIIVIAPTISTGVCGVSDYSLALAEQLVESYDNIIIGIEKRPKVLSSEINSHISVKSWSDALNIKTHNQEIDVLLNFTPFSYSRFGYPLNLLNALTAFKKGGPNRRLFLLIHESWSGSSHLPIHHLLRDRVVRFFTKRLLKISNKTAVVTTVQKGKIKQLDSSISVRINPIGSNILPSAREIGITSRRTPGILLVFGLPHTRLWALEANLRLLKSKFSAGALLNIIAIGPVDKKYSGKAKQLIKDNLGSEILKELGVLNRNEVSTYMLSVEAALLGQSIQNLSKSGTFNALAAHGVPVINYNSIVGMDITSNHLCLKINFEGMSSLNISELIEQERKSLFNWFWSTRSWEAIGDDFLDWTVDTDPLKKGLED